ncbi:MAG: ABC transporter permease [Eubacterium sp.]|nr:ABC transporter permease [Eubacterium sp.]
MKLFFNRFFILLKRSMRQPVNLAMLVILLTLAVIYRQVPSSEKTLYMPVALLCEDSDPVMQKTVDDLIHANSIFHFYTVDSREQMYEDISSGAANSGFVIPAEFTKNALSTDTKTPIEVYTTQASMLPSLSRDEVFSHFIRYYALEIAVFQIKESQAYSGEAMQSRLPEILENLHEIYERFINSSDIFRVEDASGGVYNELTREEKVDIPVRKLAGLFILVAGLIGIATYLKDSEERLYMRLRGSERYVMRLLHIVSCILPMSIITWPVLWITEGGNGLILLGQVALYTLMCTVYAYLFSMILRTSAIYQKVLPILLTMAIIFGGVLFDISSFDNTFKIVSMCLPTYYF